MNESNANIDSRLTQGAPERLRWFRICLLALFWSLPILPASSPTDSFVDAASQGQSTITWRLTKQGWQDIGPLLPRSQHQLNPWTKIHPATWAAGLVLVISGLLIWSSSEWEIDRCRAARLQASESSPLESRS